MRIGIVLLIVAALWPWRADAQDIGAGLAMSRPAATCQIQPEGPWYHPDRAGEMACEWTAALDSTVSKIRGDWAYEAGITLFLVGNAVAFSFPLWAALGADVYTVTGVVVAGETIEVVGIYLLGEEAFQDLKGTLRDMADQLGNQINRLKASSPVWS